MIALVGFVVADVAVYTSLRSYLYSQESGTLRTSELSMSHVASAPTLHGVAPDLVPGHLPGASGFCGIGREAAPGMFIEVRTVKNTPVSGEECPAFQSGSKSYSPKLPAKISSLTVEKIAGSAPTTPITVASTAADGPTFRVLTSILPNGDTLIVADPISAIANTLRQLLLVELLVAGCALVGSLLLGFWLAGVGLRPLKDVERTADAITGGDLMHRVPNANTRTEVGHVATALNVMLERIESAFNDLQISESRLRRFVSDASHELRTPIAAVSAYSQLLRQGAASHQEDLDRVTQGIERESGRMTRLVEDLLLLARFEEHLVVEPETLELVGLAAESIETARTVGSQWPLSLEADGPVEVVGDRVALRQVLDNLLSNVRAHTPPGTKTKVSVGQIDDRAVVEVSDDGPGFTEEEAGMVFDRFFRVDPSRSRQTGGAGLGLAIVTSIVTAHGGRVEATSRPGAGATFRFILPALDQTASSFE
jgi:two-component system OmpR family sensor kinase